jgi:hypothetical protein
MQHSADPLPPHDVAESHNLTEISPSRRAFLAQMAVAGFGLAASAPLMAACAAAPPDSSAASSLADPTFSEAWLDELTGKHKQFFDAVSPNDGFALLFAANFLNQYNAAYKIPDSDLTAVVGLRHFAAPMGFNDGIWSKYKLGEFFKVNDPKTKAPATRNIYLQDDGMMFPGATIPALQKRGVKFTMCNVALNVLSGMTAQAAGLPKEGAADEWVAGLLPGVVRVPVGTIAVNRAQEKGCTYCAGG